LRLRAYLGDPGAGSTIEVVAKELSGRPPAAAVLAPAASTARRSQRYGTADSYLDELVG
jgi:hypothetical protein